MILLLEKKRNDTISQQNMAIYHFLNAGNITMQKTNNVINGRIVDLIFDAGVIREIVLAHDYRISHVTVQGCDIAVGVGDLIEIKRAPDGKTTRIQLIASPQGKSAIANADAFRWYGTAVEKTPTRAECLIMRQKVIKAIRQYFEEQGFLEVQVPLLVHGTCPDPFVDSISVGERYLSTSTEYQIKRLVAGGFKQVFTLGPNYRESDISNYHNPEFTMLEWARAYSTLEDIENDAEKMIRYVAEAIRSDKSNFLWNQKIVDFSGDPWERVTVLQALKDHLGVVVSNDFSLDSIRHEVRRLNLQIPNDSDNDRHLLFSILLDELQNRIGSPTPVFLKDWPSFMTASAELKGDNCSLTDRSELIMAGLEISDGFPWLTDAEKQENLFDGALRTRQQYGKKSVVLDDKYLEALRSGMPPGAGMALGVDRLMMIVTGAKNIREVLAFSWEEV